MSGSVFEFLIGEFAAGAAEAALDFVRDQCGVVVESQLARPVPKGVGHFVNAALALDRLDHDGADGIVELGVEIGDVVEANEFHAGNQRLERLTVFHRIRDRKRAEGAAVEGIFHCEETRLWPGRRSSFGGFGMRVSRAPA